VQSTNHSILLICMNLGVHRIFNGHFVCGVSCLSIVVHLSALHAVLYIEKVCTYRFRECYIGNKLSLLYNNPEESRFF
jgi:TM2 domain-containing membrane protein YozV